MVLQEGDEGVRRQEGAGLAARRATVGHLFALEGEALGQGAAEPGGVALVVCVVAGVFAGGGHVQRVVDVVVPLGVVEAGAAVGAADEPARLVVLVLQHQVRLPVAGLGAHGPGDGCQDVLGTLVDDGMDGVEPQAVEVIVADPIPGVLHHELAEGAAVLAVVVQGVAPGGLVAAGEGGRRHGRQHVPVRPEVVVDHVEQHHQAAGVGGVHQGFEVLGPAIGAVRGEGKDPVIAPVARAREISHRHDLDAGDAEIRQVVQACDGGAEGPLRGEGPKVQLIEHRLAPGPAAPSRVGPGEGGRVDDFAGAMHVLGLEPRGRIGDQPAVRQLEPVARPGRGQGDVHRTPAVLQRLHRDGPLGRVQPQAHIARDRRP